jgi:lipoic acid synthetase
VLDLPVVNGPRTPRTQPLSPDTAPPIVGARPDWLKVRLSQGPHFKQLKQLMREQGLHTICEEAACPNIGECWGEFRTASFLLLGDVCTRNCGFCDVTTGRPGEVDWTEPTRLAEAVARLELRHVVITSVTRDDLPDGGAAIFAATIRQLKRRDPSLGVEVLIPDFQGNWDALATVMEASPDILNHNLETVPRLYRRARPGGNYPHSLKLLADFKARHPHIPTKSGLMVGLGETDQEILEVMRDLRAHHVDMLTVGQYLQPSPHHLPVERFVHPDAFVAFEREAAALGFTHAAVGPMVRSSYHADRQAHAAGVS